MQTDVQHRVAEASLAVTGITLPAAWVAWLENIDAFLRVGLTAVGIVSGIYAALYYRRMWQAQKRDS